MEKITLTRKIAKEEEVETGDEGDLILIKVKGREGYRLGKFKEINESFAQGKNVPVVVLKGVSYNLFFTDVFGQEIIDFRKSHYVDDKYFTNRIEDFVVGKERIVEYINNIQNGRYKKHADFIRGIK